MPVKLAWFPTGAPVAVAPVPQEVLEFIEKSRAARLKNVAPGSGPEPR